MCRIISKSELHHLGYIELRALFNKINAELHQTAPRSNARRAALASLENIERAMVQRLSAPQLKPPCF